MPKQPLRPGNKAPVSAQYGIHDKNGKDTGDERTGVKNKPLPPTPKPEQTYVIKDKTKTS